MKYARFVAVIAIGSLFTIPLAAQTYLNGNTIYTYSNVPDAVADANSIYADQAIRALVVPMRIMHPGSDDQMTVNLIIQPATTQYAACIGDANQASLPVQAWGIFPACSTFLSAWRVSTFSTWPAMMTTYSALTANQKATAYLLSTPATNAKYALVFQGLGQLCP